MPSARVGRIDIEGRPLLLVMGLGAQMLLAVIASGSRHERLAAVRVRGLVFHGADDPLMPVAHARDTAACIPHAELVAVDGMGQDLPHQVWPRLVDAITGLTSRS